MPTFIKAGLWIERKLSIKGEFNLTKYIQELIASTPAPPTPAETDYLDVINGYTVVGQDYTFLAGWTWVIDGVQGYTNTGEVIINFPLTSPTFSRIDAVVATTANTFVRIAGTPSTTTPASPAIPTDSVFVLFVDVDNTTVTTQPGPPGRNQVSNEAYNATTWNNVNTIAPSKNAIRDKFESLSNIGLQEIINTNSLADADGGINYINLLGGAAYNKIFEFATNGTAYSSGSYVFISKNVFEFQNYSGASKYAKINLTNAVVDITLRGTGVFTTRLVMSDNPTADTIIKVPTLNIAGTYTLATTQDVDNSRPYKVYTALISQIGTDAPIATVLDNTVGNIIWTRVGVGEYKGTLSAAFLANKVFFTITPSDSIVFFKIFTLSINEIYMQTLDSTSNLVDGYLSTTPIEIRVYN